MIDKQIETINNFIGNIDKNNTYKKTDSINKYGINEEYGIGVYYSIKHGIIKRSISQEKDEFGRKTGDTLIHDKKICPIILYATRYLIVDEKIEMEVTEGKTKLMLDDVTFTNIKDFRKLLQSLDRKYWFDGTMDEVIAIHKYIVLLSKELKLEKSYNKFGWNDNIFCPYDIGIFINDPVLKTLESAFSVKGDSNKWYKLVEEYRKNIFFETYFLSSLTAPMIEPLDLMPYTLHLSGKASSGKTASMIVCASIFGNPKELFTSFNSTLVGLENRLNTLNNLPVFLNDSQNLNININTSDFIYLIFEGKGRSRGNKDDKNRKIKTWNTVTITNGEKNLLNENVFEGANKRCIQIQGDSMDKKYSSKVRRIFNNCYGHLGKQWIEIIKSLNIENAHTIIDHIYDSINNDTNIDDNILQVTSMCFSKYLYETKINKRDNKESFELCVKTGKQILSLIKVTRQSTDMCTKIINYLKDLVLQNILRFKDDSNQERYGFFKDGNVCFFNNKLDEILINKFNYDVRLFRKEIKERGLVVTDSKDQIKQIKYENINGRYPQFFKEVIFGKEEKVIEMNKEIENTPIQCKWEDIPNV